MESQAAPPPPPPPAPSQEPYPLTFAVDYPDQNLNRLTTFFRVFTVIPIYIVLILLTGYSYGGGYNGDSSQLTVSGVGLLIAAPLVMILFRQKYPAWWADWNRELLRFINRVGIYFLLMSDKYPSTDEQQSVHLDFPTPNAEQDLNRWLPLVKWLLAIPHYIVLFFLYIAAFFCVVFAWFAILFTGTYPRSLFDFVEGVIRWHLRVTAYAIILVTDQYPPFRLSA